MGDEWKKLDANEKAPYMDLAAKDKCRYESELIKSYSEEQRKSVMDEPHIKEIKWRIQSHIDIGGNERVEMENMKKTIDKIMCEIMYSNENTSLEEKNYQKRWINLKRNQKLERKQI